MMTPEQQIEKLIADQARRIADLEAALFSAIYAMEQRDGNASWRGIVAKLKLVAEIER